MYLIAFVFSIVSSKVLVCFSAVDIGVVYKQFSYKDSLLPSFPKRGALESFAHFLKVSKQEDFKNILLSMINLKILAKFRLVISKVV